MKKDNSQNDAFARLQTAASHACASPHSGRSDPTEGQALAGNYKKGRIVLHGLPLVIENPLRSVRSGTSETGKQWSNRLAAHYGEISGTLGADGDPVDIFVGPFPEVTTVYVINQGGIGGVFDEHKAMLGFGNEQQARDAYLHSFDRGWDGLLSCVTLTMDQFKRWLANGDMSRPLTIDQLPFDGSPMTTTTKWDAAAQPATPMNRLMYAMRTEDRDNLLLDSVSLGEILADPDCEAISGPLLDALVVKNNRMPVKMDQMLRIMNTVESDVQAVSYEISTPIRMRGVLQICVLFTLSDGQAVAIWFHNPDTTPAKLLPTDDLISWKWMLNKKDVTIVIAPERGKDLNPREVARRVMRLASRNSSAFQKANVNASARVAEEKELDTEIQSLEAKLASIQTQIEVTRERASDDANSAQLEANSHYSNRISLALVRNHGWTVSSEQAGGIGATLKKTFAGTQVSGEVGDGSTEAFAAWDDAGRYLTLQVGFDDVFDMDARDKDITAFAEEFSRRADAWAAGKAEDIAEGARVAQAQAEWEQTSAYVAGLLAEVTLEAGDRAESHETIKTHIEDLRQYVTATWGDSTPAEVRETADTKAKNIRQWIAEADERGSQPESVEPSPIERVDAAYVFPSATDEFKTHLARSVGETDYSPFHTAMTLDKALRGAGMSVDWRVDQSSMLDQVRAELDAEEKPEAGTEPLLDAVPMGDAEGVITKEGVVVGRVGLALGDGKALIFVGAEGDERVKPADGDYTFRITEDADMLNFMVEGLVASLAKPVAPAVERQPVSKGERVFYKPEFQDEGDADIVFIAMEDESEGRVLVQAQLGLPINPVQMVQENMIERSEAYTPSIETLTELPTEEETVELTPTPRSGTEEEQAGADAALAMAAGVVAELGGTVTADGYSGEGTAGAWSYANAEVNGKSIRLAASGGGVVQVDGKPHGPDGSLNLSADQVRASILAVAPEIEAPAPAVVDAPAENDLTRLNALMKLVTKDAIMSDDPDAIAKLEAKFNYLSAKGDMMRKANKLLRKDDLDGLRAMGFTEKHIEGLKTPDFANRTGFPDYEMTNNNGEMRRVRLRLEDLKKQAAAVVVQEPAAIDWTKAEQVDDFAPLAALGTVTINDVGSENVYFVADGKPYFTKLLNTDDYTAGQEVDLSVVAPGSVDPVPAAVVPSVAEEAAKHGLTAETESNPHLEGSSFYSIKKDGVSVGRLYPSENAADDDFTVTTEQGESVGKFNLQEAMNQVVTLVPVAVPAPVVPEATENAEEGADRAYLEALIGGTGDLLAEDTFAKLEPLFEKYGEEGLTDMSKLLVQAAEAYGNAAVAAANDALKG